MSRKNWLVLLWLVAFATVAQASKILINNTASPVVINDVGQTVPASGQLTINPSDYPLYAQSSNAITLVGNGTLTVNDGSGNLSISDGSNLLLGLFPSAVNVRASGSLVTSTLLNGNKQALDVNAVGIAAEQVADENLSGSLTAACPTGVACPPGSTLTMTTSGVSSAILDLTGTWVATVVLDGSMDNFVSFRNVSLWTPPAGLISTGVTTNGLYRTAAIAAFKQLRIRLPSYTSGTVQAQLGASIGTATVIPISPNPSSNQTQVFGTDGINTHGILTDVTGKLELDAISGVISLPTNAAQENGGHLASIDGKLTTTTGGALKTDSSSFTQPISAVALPLPLGAATAPLQSTGNTTLASIDGKMRSYNLNSGGSEQVQGVNLRVTGATGSIEVGTSTNPLRIDPVGLTTQPISVASLPLPSGAATEGTLSALNTKVTTSVNGIKVDGSSVTQPISASSLPLPTGASTETTLSALNTKVTTTANGVKVDASATTQPVSGTVTANIGTTNGLALDATVAKLNVVQSAALGSNTGPLIQGSVTTAAPTYITGNVNPLSLTTAGALRTDASGTTQPVSGTVTANAGTGTFNIAGTVQPGNTANTTPWLMTINQGGNSAFVTGANALKIDGSATTQPVSGTVTANVGTTNGLALDATVSSVQGSVSNGTAATKSTLVGGVFNTALPTLTNGQQAALQTDTSARLLVGSIAGALPTGSNTIGAVTQAAGPWTSNVTQFGGNNVVTGTGVAGVGVPRVTVSSDSNVLATQFGTWIVQPGNTANTTPWLTTINQGGNSAAVTAASALKVDGSATTQPVSGTVTANIGTTNGLALDATVAKLTQTQGSTTSGQSGPLIQGAVTTSAPVYTTAQTSPFSLTTAGALRTDASATTQPVSGTVTSNQGTAAALAGAWPVKMTDGTNTVAVKAASTAAVAADSSAVVALSPNSPIPTGSNVIGAVTQSGTWIVQQGTPPWQIVGNVAAGSADSGNGVKVSGVFNTALPTLANGQRGDMQYDSNSRQIISPLTNTSVVKAQLQDNAGNGVTSTLVGSSRAADANVVQTVLPLDLNANGSLTAACATGTGCPAGSTIPLSINGVSSGILDLTGTWAGTIAIDGSSDNFTSFRNVSLWTPASVGFITGGVTANGAYRITALSAFKQIRARMTVFTSGSASVQLTASLGPSTLVALSPNASTNLGTSWLNDGVGNSIASQTISASNWIQAVNPSESAPGAVLPARATLVGGSDGTNIRAITTDTSGNTNVVGNVASGVADSGNPVKVGGKFNSTPPTLTNGQRGDVQLDLNGRVQVNAAPVDGTKASYMASITGLALSAAASDVFTITGSATTTVRVTKVGMSCTQTTGGIIDVVFLRRSTADTLGVSTTLTAVRSDANDAAAGATVRSYTVNPTVGTLVGNILSSKFVAPDPTGGSVNSAMGMPPIWVFADRAKGQVLRGASQVLAVNFNGQTVNGSNCDIFVEWTEE